MAHPPGTAGQTLEFEHPLLDALLRASVAGVFVFRTQGPLPIWHLLAVPSLAMAVSL